MDVRKQMNNIRRWRSTLNESIKNTVNTENLIAYHRSPKLFNEFHMNYAADKEHRQYGGYGLYFSNKIPNKEYGDFLYKVKLSNILLLNASEKVDEKIFKKVVNNLKKKYKNYKEIYKYSHNSFLFYKTISRIVGGDKQAASFLSNNDVDGLKRHIGGDLYDYILFNTLSIHIESVEIV